MMSEGNRLDRRGFLKGLLTDRGLGLLKFKHRMLVHDEVHDVERELASSAAFAAMR